MSNINKYEIVDNKTIKINDKYYSLISQYSVKAKGLIGLKVGSEKQIDLKDINYNT